MIPWPLFLFFIDFFFFFFFCGGGGCICLYIYSKYPPPPPPKQAQVILFLVFAKEIMLSVIQAKILDCSSIGTQAPVLLFTMPMCRWTMLKTLFTMIAVLVSSPNIGYQQCTLYTAQ